MAIEEKRDPTDLMMMVLLALSKETQESEN